MPRAISIILVFVLSLGASAQKGWQDVVYLKNGSIIRGMLIEQVPGVSLKIETADKSLFVYNMDEVAKITKEVIVREGLPNKGVPKGYEGMVQLGYGVQLEQYGADRAKLNIVNGYRFSPRFVAGLGLGLRQYIGPGRSTLLLPVFLHLRTNILNRRVSPYLSADIGTSFNASDDFTTEGLILNGGIGVSLRLGQRTALLIGAGYDLQRLRVFELQGSYYRAEYIERSVNSSAVSLNAGLSF